MGSHGVRRNISIKVSQRISKVGGQWIRNASRLSDCCLRTCLVLTNSCAATTPYLVNNKVKPFQRWGIQ
jgi:hypothetical protein